MSSGFTPPGLAGARDVRSALRQGAAALFVFVVIVTGIVALGALILLAVPVLIGLVLAAWVVRFWRGLRAPNGVLDGRRNVRVVVRH